MPKNAEALDRADVLDMALSRIEAFAKDLKELDRFLELHAPKNPDVQRVVRTAVEATLKLRQGRRLA